MSLDGEFIAVRPRAALFGQLLSETLYQNNKWNGTAERGIPLNMR